jgi:hypothetical protein
VVKGIKLKRYRISEVDAAVALLKAERPDIWKRWTELEEADEAPREVADALWAVFTNLPFVEHHVHATQVISLVRRRVRLEAGLWVGLGHRELDG